MASTINSALGGVAIASDASGALDIQTGGVNAISIGTGQTVTISNALTNLTIASATITTLSGTSATITTISDGVGNVRNIPSAGAAKTSEYTLTISDIGEFITLSTSGKVLVPNNTFSTGNAVSVYNDTTSNASINISTTTAYITGTNTTRTGVTLATRGIANILFINPSYCIVSGNVT